MAYAPPVDPDRSRLTSGYGWRISRRTGRRTFHAGLDFLAPRGAPLFAVASGQVAVVGLERERASRTRGYGNVVALHHPELAQWTVYAHCSRLLVEPGQPVEPGQQIAVAGNTSNGKFPRMGPHLHFEVRNPRPDGSSPFPGPYRRYNVDPRPWLADRGIVLRRRGLELAEAVVRPEGLSGPVMDPSRAEAPAGPDEEGLPDEPVRDPWTFDPVAPTVWIGLTAAAAVSAAAGVAVVRAAWAR